MDSHLNPDEFQGRLKLDKQQAAQYVIDQQTYADKKEGELDEDELSNRNMARTESVTSRDKKSFRMGSGIPQWLHTNITKRQAIELLKAEDSPVSGIFLVRAKANNPGVYVLDVGIMENEMLVLYHYPITRSTNGEMVIDERPSSTGARTIEGLIDELHKSNLSIRHNLVRGIARVGDATGIESHPFENEDDEC
eukprot:m.340727 g.340727  ORF g.340727 m.340727 type:complete len:194 (-) comp19488_c0_seq1:126-707(-)